MHIHVIAVRRRIHPVEQSLLNRVKIARRYFNRSGNILIDECDRCIWLEAFNSHDKNVRYKLEARQYGYIRDFNGNLL